MILIFSVTISLNYWNKLIKKNFKVSCEQFLYTKSFKSKLYVVVVNNDKVKLFYAIEKFLFFIFISIFILLTRRKATEALYVG